VGGDHTHTLLNPSVSN